MTCRKIGALVVSGALLFFVAACAREMPAVAVEPTVIVAPISTPTPLAQTNRLDRADAAKTATPAPNRDENRAVTIEMRDAPIVLPARGAPYATGDFLRDYFTKRTYPLMIEGKAWTNSTVNVAQLQEERGGVTYWDFFSELENWDSPFFMWQDEGGQWHPYQKEIVRDATGQTLNAYVLVDRQGPGALDKLWFTQDAVWMLATAESARNVGALSSMDELIEWGNLEKLGNLRVEVDDRLAYDGSLKDWIAGRAWGLTPELAAILTWRHREFGSSGNILPVLYQKHLRVLVYGGNKKPKWFLATGVRFADGVAVQPYRGTKTDLPIDELSRLARNVTQPEAYISTQSDVRAFDLVARPDAPATIRLNGAGSVSALQFIVAKKFDPQALWLTIKYGDQVGVNLPLVAFFGDHKEIALHRSTPLGIVQTDEAYIFYCNLPLPFQDGMTIELATKAVGAVMLSARVALSRETTRAQLWTLYRGTEKLSVYGPDYRVQLSGDGKLVGLVLVTEDQDLDKIPKIFSAPNVEDPVRRAWSMGYLEGNLSLRDGAGNARVYGGHEDWADGGFYFNRGYTNPSGGSNRPFGGILRYKDGVDGYATIFRYFNDLSAFRFRNGLTMDFGHGTWRNNFGVRYGVTVYYYKE